MESDVLVTALKNIQDKMQETIDSETKDNVVILVRVPDAIRDKFPDDPIECFLESVTTESSAEPSLLVRLNLKVVVMPSSIIRSLR